MTDGFRFSPGILSRLGEELVPESEQGIVELAKNAYDADATYCTVELDAVHHKDGAITISDDGGGMTAEEIRSGWLVIGKSSKDRRARTPIFLRTPAGDKGLGRLAALRLGRRVQLKTRPRSQPGVEHSLTINWDSFDEAEHVEDVAIDLESGPTKLGHGTDISIELLSKPFNRTNANKLARSLLLLSDPFRSLSNESAAIPGESAPKSSDPGFKAKLLTQEFADLQAKVSQSYFPDAEYRINAELDTDGTARFRILDWKNEVLHASVAPRPYRAPELSFDLWVFVLDAKSFSTRSSTVGEVRDWLNQVGGVHIYEDGIRVPPYGGTGDDWLELNLRRARSPEQRPSTNTSIGRVRLSNIGGALAQKTDRIGYIENEAFAEVRQICIDALNWTARLLVNERDRKRRAEMEAATKDREQAQSKLNAVLSKSVPTVDRKVVDTAIAKFVKDSGRENRSLREELQLYRSLATAGMTSAVFAHEIGRPLDLIDKGIEALQRLIPAEKKQEGEKRAARISKAKVRLNSFVSIPLTMLAKRKRRSGRVNINDCVRELLELLDPITEYYHVTTQVNLTSDYAEINGSEALIDGILLNLLMNSLNAFQREGFPQPSRRIRLETISAPGAVQVTVEDNAGGLDGIEENDIWLPGVTTSQEGTGFGLTIVRDSVADLSGSIDVIARTEFGGAKFIARFPPMQTLFE